MVEITGGVDTHADTHTVAALDGLGRLLGHATFSADPAGYVALHAWLTDQGTVAAVGIEGTGSYGAGLARHLHQAHLEVVEVDRPDRRTRRRSGKSDPLDAIAAARAVQAGTATGNPKTRDGAVEAIRVLRVARRSAVKSRTAALNALRQLIITAPAALRAQLAGLPESELITTCARLRPTTAATAATAATAVTAPLDPSQATKSALRRLARRCQHLSEEIADADADLAAALNHTAPRLLEAFGVGAEVAGQLLVTAGDNPDRIRHDAAFAALCGVNPLPASSGRTTRHRINRGGDRAANSALYTVAIVRMRHHQPTRDYVARRIAEGRTKREIIRCLKRYIARELLPLIHNALTHPHPT
jgi:transposase